MTEVDYSVSDAIPYGYCHCGCGQRTRIAPVTRKDTGDLKGEPKRFLYGHASRIRAAQMDRYVIEDRGYKTPCWVWTGNTVGRGYAVFGVDNSKRYAHRHYFEAKYGPIPKGLQPHHLCEVKNCVNPDHIEVLTPSEHNKRTWASQKERAARA